MEGVELVGVVDASLERAQEYAEKFGCKAFATEAELLAEGVDAVSIAVPTTFHLKSAEPFLKAGVACLIEKPLAQGADEAEKIKKIAEEHNACLMVGHIERFNPIMRAMQRATESFGEPIIPRFNGGASRLTHDLPLDRYRGGHGHDDPRSRCSPDADERA